MRITQSESEAMSKRRRKDDPPPPPHLPLIRSSSSSITCFNLSFFPLEDVIDEILLRLPLKSLMKFRCVCKYFFNQITSPSFVYKHLHQSTSRLNNHLLLLSVHDYSLNKRLIHTYSCKFNGNNDPDIVDMHFPFESAVIQFSCNGLLYLDLGSYRNCIWNPFTKEYKGLSRPTVLPPPSEQGGVWFINGFCGFGYDRTNDVYKVLYFGCLGKQANYYLNDYGSRGITFITEFNLYTIGKGSDTLRRINRDDNRYSSLGFGRWNQTGLFVNGALHWIMSSKDSVNCSAAKASIISFDIENEVFGEIPKPQSIPEEDEYYGDLQVLQGCICICQLHKGLDQDIDVWMLKDYAVKDSWTKTFTIALRNSLLCIGSALRLLRLYRNGEIVMGRDADSLIVYDSINHKARHVENIKDLEGFFVHQMTYVESLVSLDTGIYSG